MRATKWIIAIWTVCLFSTFNPLARAQCFTESDDLSIVGDTDLRSIQDFNLDLFKSLLPKNPLKNFVFSPYSIWNALALGYFGSAGETQRQFEEVLRVPDKLSTLRKWRQLEFLYSERKDGNAFILSNRIYFDESVPVRRCMKNILHNEIQQLEIMKDPTSSANIINKFVSDKTRGHINQLVNPMDIMNAYMVLVNAAYFKGSWKQTFDKRFTMNLPFTTFTKETVDIPMMSQFGEFRYGYNDENRYEILELPYVGEKVSMFFFLPYDKEAKSFQDMINSFSHESLERNLKDLFPTNIHIFIPKFTIDTTVEDELIQAIYKMGLTDAFINRRANFSDFSFDRNLKLDQSIHKAFIEVNEEGTEAAAATAFISSKIGGNSRFICNRPFVFLIRDDQTKNILFAGTFQAPAVDSNVKPSTSSPREQGLSGVKNDQRKNEIPAGVVQNKIDTPLRLSTFSPVGRLRPGNEFQVTAIHVPSENFNYIPREYVRVNINERNKPKNSFNPNSFRGSIPDILPRPSVIPAISTYIPNYNENRRTENINPTLFSYRPTSTISHTTSTLSPVRRPLPENNNNIETRVSQNGRQKRLDNEQPFPSVITYAHRRYLINEKNKEN